MLRDAGFAEVIAEDRTEQVLVSLLLSYKVTNLLHWEYN